MIKQWKEAQVIKLEAKDREEEKAKQVLKQQAKKELEDWYKQHSEQVSTFAFSPQPISSLNRVFLKKSVNDLRV